MIDEVGDRFVVPFVLNNSTCMHPVDTAYAFVNQRGLPVYQTKRNYKPSRDRIETGELVNFISFKEEAGDNCKSIQFYSSRSRPDPILAYASRQT